MRLKSRLGLLAVLGLIAATALAAACGSNGESNGNESKPAATSASTKNSGSSSSGKSETVTVSMKDNFFEPKDLTVEAGDTITFIAKNEGQALHNMMIQSAAAEGKDFMSDAMVNPGAESKFTATFKKKGTIKFQCAYHMPDMVGTITVK